jgi:hypothetical protein
MRALFLTLLLTTNASAELLSTITLYNEVAQPPAATQIGFAIVAFGPASSLLVNSSASDTTYYVPTQDVNTMYAMAHNPAAYQQHGPVLVSANIGDYVLDPWHKLWQEYVTTIAEPNYSANGGTVHGSDAVLNTPWQAVSLSRTAWQPVSGGYGSTLTVNIYDQPVPEPSTMILVACLFSTLGFRLRR